MSGEYEHTYVCESCGDEVSLIIKPHNQEGREQLGGTPEPGPKKGTIACKICGSEADMILEEI